MRKKDVETMNLFGEEPLQPGERGYLHPDYRREGDQIIHVPTGNVVDENYNVIREARSEKSKAYKLAEKYYPDLVGTPDFPTVIAAVQRMLDGKEKEK